MSTCISRHGEYSDHILDDDFICTRCTVLDEDALIEDRNRLRRERDEWRAEVDRLNQQLHRWNTNLTNAKAEVERLDAKLTERSQRVANLTLALNEATGKLHAVRELAARFVHRRGYDADIGQQLLAILDAEAGDGDA